MTWEAIAQGVYVHATGAERGTETFPTQLVSDQHRDQMVVMQTAPVIARLQSMLLAFNS